MNNNSYIITDNILNKISSIMKSLGSISNSFYEVNVNKNLNYLFKMEGIKDEDFISKYTQVYNDLDNININDFFSKLKYRECNLKDTFTHPRVELIPNLFSNLNTFINHTGDTHPFLMASLFYYGFIFISPFEDNNHIVAMVWLNKYLRDYNEAFKYLSLESYIYKYKVEYYESLKSDKTFIDFLLKIIDLALKDLLSHPIYIEDKFLKVDKLLKVMEKNKPMTAYEIMNKLNIKSKETFRNSYLNYAIEEKLVNLTVPDKPTSRNQMYYKV